MVLVLKMFQAASTMIINKIISCFVIFIMLILLTFRLTQEHLQLQL
jgi:hypothetical protein